MARRIEKNNSNERSKEKRVILYKNKAPRLGVQASDRVLAQHARGSGFDLQHQKEKKLLLLLKHIFSLMFSGLKQSSTVSSSQHLNTQLRLIIGTKVTEHRLGGGECSETSWPQCSSSKSVKINHWLTMLINTDLRNVTS